jgi:hypothetical protein
MRLPAGILVQPEEESPCWRPGVEDPSIKAQSIICGQEGIKYDRFTGEQVDKRDERLSKETYKHYVTAALFQQKTYDTFGDSNDIGGRCVTAIYDFMTVPLQTLKDYCVSYIGWFPAG